MSSESKITQKEARVPTSAYLCPPLHICAAKLALSDRKTGERDEYCTSFFFQIKKKYFDKTMTSFPYSICMLPLRYSLFNPLI